MQNGGKRKGAGRPKGSPNKATLDRQKKAQQSGAMPAEVMLDAMRYHYDIAITERRKPKPMARRVASELNAAAGFARDAAPYYHPRLATLQSNVNLTGRLTLEALINASLPSPANDDTMKLIEGEVTENVPNAGDE